jgi:DNA-binding NarL/FixJ family response regulator
MPLLRILVAETSSLVRERVASALRERVGIVDLREAATQRSALDTLAAFSPHVALLDARMTGAPLSSVLASAAHASPRTRFVVLTWDPRNYAAAFAAGVPCDFVDKADIDGLVSTVYRAVTGEQPSPSVRTAVPGIQ